MDFQFTPQAAEDLDEIWWRIAADSPPPRTGSKPFKPEDDFDPRPMLHFILIIPFQRVVVVALSRLEKCLQNLQRPLLHHWRRMAQSLIDEAGCVWLERVDR